MNKEKIVIGVLGGMGTYATINLFNEYAKVFPAEREWERPRIIIDNRCTMPSRVMAYLYNEKVDELVSEMTESMNYLSEAGCTKIILACMTSHLFLPKIYEKIPNIKGKVVHLIENCANIINKDNIKNVYVLGSEATIDSKIFQNELDKYNIKCDVPGKEEYTIMRDCIEAVKRNNYTDDIKDKFLNLINRSNYVILGCTELPILYERYKDGITCKKAYDPLKLALETIKKEEEND
jgi:aspartate racemase